MRTSSLLYAGLGLGVLAIGFVLLQNMEKDLMTRGDTPSSFHLFATACIEPVLAGKDDVGEACRSTAAIKQTYDVDIKSYIDARHDLMKKTARRIAEGDLLKPQDYKNCIAEGQCAEVPLLAANVDPEKMNAEQRAASAIFWDLAEQDKMTLPVCNALPECRVMTKLKVLDYGF